MKILNELIELANKANLAGQGTPEMVDFRVVANPDTILAIAEAFKELEQREEAAEADVQKLLKTIYEEKGVALRIVDKLHAAEAKLADLEKQKLAAEVKLYRQKSIIPEGLNRCTAELVLDFAKDLAEKLYRSEQKYGWSDGWKESDWQEKCLADFHHHISKGDPRDVAAYCAFMWHHEWPTRPAPAINLVELVPDEMFMSDAVRANMSTDRMDGYNDCRAAILKNIEGME